MDYRRKTLIKTETTWLHQAQQGERHKNVKSEIKTDEGFKCNYVILFRFCSCIMIFSIIYDCSCFQIQLKLDWSNNLVLFPSFHLSIFPSSHAVFIWTFVYVQAIKFDCFTAGEEKEEEKMVEKHLVLLCWAQSWNILLMGWWFGTEPQWGGANQSRLSKGEDLIKFDMFILLIYYFGFGLRGVGVEVMIRVARVCGWS